MATSDADASRDAGDSHARTDERVGMDHLTVVPANYDDGERAGSGDDRPSPEQ